MADMGSKMASWVMFPALGAGDIEFDYYNLIAIDSYADFGVAWENMVNGGGMQKGAAINDGTSTCDSPRMSDSRMVRTGTAS